MAVSLLQRSWRWVGLHPWVTILVIIVAGNVGAWRAIDAESEARLETACESGSSAREVIRDMAHRVGVASGQESGEALIDVVGADADPQVVEAYRERLASRLTARLTEIVNELPDRQWIDGECVDVPVE